VENTLRAATAMAVLTGMGYLVYNVKLIPKYAGNPPPDKDPKNMTGFDKFLIGASTSGVLGMGNTIPGVVSAVKYGASPGDVVLGPTLGQAFDLTESAARSYLKKDTDPLEKTVIQGIPGPSVSPFLTKEAIDLKEFLSQ
ncbi:MAG: hypothetical protein ACREBU_00780, partial [Nitrososphaera sp.]